ncbi:MAG: low molecular weight protein arginine phosphatase [Elusimicrobiota bacterium]
MTRSVLFVCTGNTCRSPMAEYFFVQLSREAGLPCAVSSAGTQAAIGMPLSSGAAAVFAARGIGPVSHRARRACKTLLDQADAVYVMERAHRDDLASRFPESAAKIAVLREAAGLMPVDVEDPAETDAARYQSCASSIEEALKIIVLRERAFHAPNPR